MGFVLPFFTRTEFTTRDCRLGDSSEHRNVRHRAPFIRIRAPAVEVTNSATKSPLASSPLNFSDSRIPQWLSYRLAELGFERPTRIQSRTLEVALPPLHAEDSSGCAEKFTSGRDVVVHAQTGCGKTLAYLIPAIAAVDPKRASVQALILVPTQELGMQVYKLLKRLTSAWSFAVRDISGTGFLVLPMLNQADLRRQKLQMRKTAPRIIVGNPHRVAVLVESGRLRLDLLRVLVVDEFDACLLDASTTSALQTVLSTRGREPRQTILASATVPQHRHFLRQCVRQRWAHENIEHVWMHDNEGQTVPSTLRHLFAVVDGRKKLSALRTLLLRFGQGKVFGLPKAIVFIMTSRPVLPIVNALNEACFGTADASAANTSCAIVGLADDMSVLQRARSLRRFRGGDASVLVATDVAARGLDIDGITHVFHMDLARDADAYLHRAGRAGRFGRDGTSVALVTTGEEFVIRRTSNALGIDFKRLFSS